jgi:Domain of unknown function (DUF397)
MSQGNSNCVEVSGWRTSAYSGSDGNCVEVGEGSAVVAIRDTKDRDGGMLAIPGKAWQAFLSGLK